MVDNRQARRKAKEVKEPAKHLIITKVSWEVDDEGYTYVAGEEEVLFIRETETQLLIFYKDGFSGVNKSQLHWWRLWTKEVVSTPNDDKTA